jgi:hypothetical protein
VDAGMIVQDGGLYRIEASAMVDTGLDPEAVRDTKRHWIRVAADRLDQPRGHEAFGYNVFAVSQADLDRIRQLYRAFHARCEPSSPRRTPRSSRCSTLQLIDWR